MKDVIIIGAGPAGLTAAIYGLRAGKSILVLEAKAYGGSIINTLEIENYPAIKNISGYDFATNLYNQVKDLGAEIKYEKVIEIKDLGDKKQVITNDNCYECKAVIIATGANNRKLGLDKEEQLLGKGISYCATCDGAFYKDKIVAVNGGANTAVEDALFLSDYCKKVYIIYRRDNLRAEKIEVDKLSKKDNVEYIFNSNIIELKGNDKLESILIEDNNKNKRELKIDGLFIAIGQVPANDFFKNLIDVNENGYIVSDDNCHTNIDGIYVAGDVKEKEVRQLTTATSDGTIAMLTAIKEMK